MVRGSELACSATCIASYGESKVEPTLISLNLFEQESIPLPVHTNPTI